MEFSTSITRINKKQDIEGIPLSKATIVKDQAAGFSIHYNSSVKCSRWRAIRKEDRAIFN
jgi:hypothetical protein